MSWGIFIFIIIFFIESPRSQLKNLSCSHSKYPKFICLNVISLEDLNYIFHFLSIIFFKKENLAFFLFKLVIPSATFGFLVKLQYFIGPSNYKLGNYKILENAAYCQLQF